MVLYIYIYSWDYSVVLLGLGRKKKKKKGKFRVRNECLFNISSPSYCVWRDHSASAALGTRHSRSNEMGSALVLHRLVYSQTTRPVNGWHDHTQVHKKLRRHLLASVINNWTVTGIFFKLFLIIINQGCSEQNVMSTSYLKRQPAVRFVCFFVVRFDVWTEIGDDVWVMIDHAIFFYWSIVLFCFVRLLWWIR